MGHLDERLFSKTVGSYIFYSTLAKISPTAGNLSVSRGQHKKRQCPVIYHSWLYDLLNNETDDTDSSLLKKTFRSKRVHIGVIAWWISSSIADLRLAWRRREQSESSFLCIHTVRHEKRKANAQRRSTMLTSLSKLPPSWDGLVFAAAYNRHHH